MHRLTQLLALLTLIALIPTVQAARPTPTAQVLTPLAQLDGALTAPAMAGQYVVAWDATSDSIRLIDLRTPSQPALGATLVAAKRFVLDIAVHGALAAIANQDTLDLVDIQNPASPALRSSTTIKQAIVKVALSDTYAYVYAHDYVMDYSVSIVDVRNPRAPVIRGTIPVAPGTMMGALEVEGTTLYLTTGSVLRAFDVSDPMAPRQLGTVRLEYNIWDISLDGPTLYAAIGGMVSGAAFVAVDRSDPAALRVVRTHDLAQYVPTMGWVNSVAARDGRLYVAGTGGTSGAPYGHVLAFDVSTPAAPRRLSTFATGGTAERVRLITPTVLLVADGAYAPDIIELRQVALDHAAFLPLVRR